MERTSFSADDAVVIDGLVKVGYVHFSMAWCGLCGITVIHEDGTYKLDTYIYTNA